MNLESFRDLNTFNQIKMILVRKGVFFISHTRQSQKVKKHLKQLEKNSHLGMQSLDLPSKEIDFSHHGQEQFLLLI